MDGVTVLDHIKRSAPNIGVILITGYASLDGAVEATKLGAYHYLEKPFTPEQNSRTGERSLKRKISAGPMPVEVPGAGRSDSGFSDHRRQSPRWPSWRRSFTKLPPPSVTYSSPGNRARGKNWPHAPCTPIAIENRGLSWPLTAALSVRNSSPMNYSATKRMLLPEPTATKPVFLPRQTEEPCSWTKSETCRLPWQVKLLRVIQEREFIPVGGTGPIPLDIRIVAASAKDLKTAAAEGAFRQDLYFRLNVVSVVLPRLAERKRDIPLLAYHFLEKFRRGTQKKIRAISREAMDLLQNYPFPGNVRELENILERAVALCREEVISSERSSTGFSRGGTLRLPTARGRSLEPGGA